MSTKLPAESQNERSPLMSRFEFAGPIIQQQNCTKWEEVKLENVEDLKPFLPKQKTQAVHPKCPTCSRVFLTSKGLHLHQKTCPNFPCNSCGRIFTTVGGLTQHRNKKCSEWMKSKGVPGETIKARSRMFACKESNCGATFSSRHSLSQHARVVHR